MNRIFLADSEITTNEFSRKRAMGHKCIMLDKEVVSCGNIQVVTEGTNLVVKPTEKVEGDIEAYTFMCKEFGLVDYDAETKISVVFCDNGWMMVTLLAGSLIMYIDGQLLMPAVGEPSTKTVVKDDIYWVNEEQLLGYGKYMSEFKERYMYDYEYVFKLSGHIINGMSSFKLFLQPDEDIDLSLGYIARLEQEKKARNEAKQAKALEKQFATFTPQDNAVEFDLEDMDDEEEEEDEDDYWNAVEDE